MFQFIGWMGEHNSAIPLFHNEDLINKNGDRLIHTCRFIDHISLYFVEVPFPITLNEAEIFPSVEEVFLPRWRYPTSDHPALSRFAAPIRYTVYRHCLFVTIERDYREFAHQPCMSNELRARLDYTTRIRQFFDTPQLAENFVRQFFPTS